MSKANFNDVWLRSVFSFLNLFLTSLLCEADEFGFFFLFRRFPPYGLYEIVDEDELSQPHI